MNWIGVQFELDRSIYSWEEGCDFWGAKKITHKFGIEWVSFLGYIVTKSGWIVVKHLYIWSVYHSLWHMFGFSNFHFCGSNSRFLHVGRTWMDLPFSSVGRLQKLFSPIGTHLGHEFEDHTGGKPFEFSTTVYKDRFSIGVNGFPGNG